MPAHDRHSQRGVALMLLLMLVSVGALAVFVTGLNRAAVQNERDAVTHDALSQAKAALVGRAASDDGRPGSLPCPDEDADGDADACTSLQGGFPWKTLKMQPILDGYGDGLRYELSNSFRDTIGSEPLNHVTTIGALDGGASAARVFTPSGKSFSIPVNELFSLARKRVAGAVRLYLNHPFPPTAPVPPLPLRFNQNWAAVANYTKISDEDASLSFTNCPLLTFNYHWNALDGRAEMTWTGQC